MKDKKVRCLSCGKFIGHEDFQQDKVRVVFTPDSEYTMERIEYQHKKCMDLVNVERIDGGRL